MQGKNPACLNSIRRSPCLLAWSIGSTSCCFQLLGSNLRISTLHAMNPLHLAVVLAWLSQIPLPPQNEALDAAEWQKLTNRFMLRYPMPIITGLTTLPSNSLRLKCALGRETCPGHFNSVAIEPKLLMQLGFGTYGSTIEKCYLST